MMTDDSYEYHNVNCNHNLQINRSTNETADKLNCKSINTSFG